MPMDRRGVLALFSSVGVGLLTAARAEAAVARALGIRELVDKSKRVVVATALEQACEWQVIGGSRRIVTLTRVRVEELVTGAAPEASELMLELMLQTLGGRVGKVGQLVDGEAELVVGENSLVFTREVLSGLYGVTAMAQGYYPIRMEARGKVLRPSRSLPALINGKEAAVERLRNVTLSDGLNLVRGARR
jgi:hypothetical protein